jgi:D-glycero-alpha-D-manno-heptose-7-phosphate kinase
MLFYTRLQRNAHDVLAEQIERTSTGQIVTELGTLTQMVGDAIGVLCSARPLSEFGELLHSGWSLKRNFSSITSNDLIDKQYERARQHGAVGGKLLGAGGGGFLLFYVEPEHQAAVRRALAELPEVSFRFDRSGSRILFYEV